MLIGQRLRDLREYQKLSQGDMEKRTGLLRCYISRVENEKTVPSLETLEKFARALNVPMYQIFYEGDDQLPAASVVDMVYKGGRRSENGDWGSSGKEARLLHKLPNLLKRINEKDRQWLLFIAEKRATQRRS